MPPMQRLFLIIGACLALLVAGCGSDSSTTESSSSATTATEESPAPKETETTEASKESTSKKADEPKEKKTKPEVKVPSGPPPKSLVVKDIEKGTGAAAKAGDAISVNYVGVNYKTGKQFDASWDRGEPIGFTLGENAVIQGWEKGLVGMKVGGRRELIIPPSLGYGSAAQIGIPANETLIFVVDLEAIE
jgi:peptidylprolyl isomerase